MKFSDLQEFDMLRVETTLDCGLRPGVDVTVVHKDSSALTATCILQFAITAEELALDRLRKVGVFLGSTDPATPETQEAMAADIAIGEAIKIPVTDETPASVGLGEMIEKSIKAGEDDEVPLSQTDPTAAGVAMARAALRRAKSGK